MKNDALEIAYRQYYQPLFLYAYSLTQNKADAEDLVSYAFVKAVLSFETGHIKSWLFTVLKNEYFNQCKKKKKMIDVDMNWIEDPKDIVESFIHNEEKRWLYQQIYQLSKNEREVMLLSLQGLSDTEISLVTSLSIENVRVIKYRVKKHLIELVKKEDLS